jgi:hypothetical protein
MKSFSIVGTGILASLGMVALLGGCSSDDAGSIDAPGGTAKTFNVTLTKAQEVPPCPQAGANATGSATVTINAAGSEIQVTNFTTSGLSGAAGKAHIHAGANGVNGGIVLDFGANPTFPINHTFTAADYDNTGAMAPATFAAFVVGLRNGGTAYLNVHTGAAECPNGEIRGEIQ